MFIGAVPREVISQILDTVPFDEWGSVYVGCSGSFRFDRAVKRRYPAARVFSNDISLVTCSVGELAKGREFAIRFKDELAFIEPLVGCFFDRVAAIWVAGTMAKFRGNNPFARGHYAHYTTRFTEFLDDACLKLRALVDEIQIEEFYGGDFLEQIERARSTSGGFACFAPTYKGGYERLYRFLDKNIEWPAPVYGVWDPAKLPAMVDGLDAAGLRYCVISDQRLPGRDPATAFYGSNKPVYTYASHKRASLRRRVDRAKIFSYEPMVPEKLTQASLCEIAEIDNPRLTYLKQVYLAKGIETTTGAMAFAVLVDGMLAGAFSFVLQKFHNRASSIYLLTDFATSRTRRISKLIPMIACSREIVRLVDRKFVIRVEFVETTAFTDKPVSMKYRGVLKLHTRKPGELQYRGAITEHTPQEVYREWFRKYGRETEDRNARSAAPAERAQAA